MEQPAGPGHPVSRGDVDKGAGSPVDMETLLVRLATDSAAGDLDALDTLLYAIDSQRMAEPGIRRVVFNPDEVDEISQDVLIAVAEVVGTYRGDSRFTSWLFGIGRNKALEFVRRKRAESPLNTELGESARMTSRIINSMSVRDLLVRLPDPYRTAVVLRDLDGHSYANIAESLGLNLNTVRSHISRGRALLAAMAAEGAVGHG